MEYIKPELNQLGVAEALVLGTDAPGSDNSSQTGHSTHVPSSFEFEQ
jgi:hypothetical protein